MLKKKIVFLTATRADYGKLKSLILATQKKKLFSSFVFITGMHNNAKYGNTWQELKKDKIKNLTKFVNITKNNKQEEVLAKTIFGFSKYIKKIKPDLIIVHGDRVEPLACTITATLNNIMVAHIEGGEVSGTIDDSIRHSISKLSNLHFVTNNSAKKRLVQMGENKKNIFIIGSPDLDILLKKDLPLIEDVKKRYDIFFENYSIFVFHPVTTEYNLIEKQIKCCIKSLVLSKKKYVIIYPNNDLGNEKIFKIFKNFKNNNFFKFIPSMRFENYLSLLKHSDFIIGNSSSGIIEAPYFGVPVINIGSRQKNRLKNARGIHNCNLNVRMILKKIKLVDNIKKKNFKKISYFGTGKSNQKFLKIILQKSFWKINLQKRFVDYEV